MDTNHINQNQMSDKITWTEIKEVCTSFDNIFYGAMIYAVIGILYWLWMLMSIWLIVVPVGYVLMCYLGQYIKKHFKHGTKITQDSIHSTP